MKNTIKAFTLALVLAFSTTFAMAEGIIVFGKEKECAPTETNGIIVFGAQAGIIVFGNSATGIIVFGKEGIIVFGKEDNKQCTERNGILVSD